MRRSPHSLLRVVALLVGVALTVGLGAFEEMTVRSLDSQAASEQGVRAQKLSAELETELSASRQVASTTATLAAPMKDLPSVEGLLRGMLASTAPQYVYGIGVWFEPYQFDPKRRLVGPYVHRDLAHDPQEQLALTYEWSTPEYDYPDRSWYQQGVEGHGTTAFSEPYFDVDFVYRTLSQAFYNADGTLRGVVSVDIVLPQLRELVMRANVSPDELFYVVTRGERLFAHPDEQRLLSWARHSGRLTSTGHLSDLTLEDLRAYEHEKGLDRTRYTRAASVSGPEWTIYVSTDKGVLFAPARRVRLAAGLVGLTLWSALLLGGVTLRHSFQLRELERTLAERQRMQEVLIRSERTLREVLETTSDAVVVVNASARIVDWNASAAKMLGWRREEVLGRPAVEVLVPAEDRSLRQSQFQQLLGSGMPEIDSGRLEVTGLRRQGEHFPAEVSLTAVSGNAERQLFLFLNDITERRRTEEERRRMLERQRTLLAQLRQRSAELQAIIDNMVEGVFVVATDGRVAYVNQAGRRLGGIASFEQYQRGGKAEGAQGLQDLDGTALPLEALPLYRAFQGEVVDRAMVVPAQDGGEPRVVSGSAAPIFDEEGQVVAAVMVTHDITEAVEFDRLKDEFIRMAAHELKTPVTVMKSFAQQALKTEAGRASSFRRLLEGIDRGATRIDRVVRTLLDVSELHLGRMHLIREELDLRGVVEAAARRMAEEHRDHPVRVSTQGPLPVHGDRGRLEQVVIALLDNAFRYSPPLADVEVEVRAEGAEAEVSVRDHGIGIPRAKQARLFERCYRPHSGTPYDTGGLGMSLYIARELVRQHGGHILLESEEGKGTTIRVRLPLREAHAHRDLSPPPAERHEAAAGLESP